MITNRKRLSKHSSPGTGHFAEIQTHVANRITGGAGE